MEDGKIDRWIATIGLVTLAIILVLESVAVYRLNVASIHYKIPVIEWSETMMRLFFGKIR